MTPKMELTEEMRAATLERAYPDPECGCPVEEWIANGVHLTIHFEPEGEMEAFADGGEWDCIVPLRATVIEDARIEAFAWAHALPREEPDRAALGESHE